MNCDLKVTHQWILIGKDLISLDSYKENESYSRFSVKTEQRDRSSSKISYHLIVALTVIVQCGGPGDEDKKEEGRESKPHAEELCFWREKERRGYIHMQYLATSYSDQVTEFGNPTHNFNLKRAVKSFEWAFSPMMTGRKALLINTGN